MTAAGKVGDTVKDIALLAGAIVVFAGDRFAFEFVIDLRLDQ